jgi:hypothetical protein
MPDASLPLYERLPVLEALAREGNGEAACRYTIEMYGCASEARRRRFHELMQESLVRPGSERRESLFVDLIAGDQERNASPESNCAGIAEAQLADPSRYLPFAVANLTARQKTMLAMMRPDGRIERFPRTPRDVVPMELDTYFVTPQYLADNAYRFLESGIAARDPMALEGMLLTHCPSWIPGVIRGARLAAPDPRRFLYFSTVMTEVFGEPALGEFGAEIRDQVMATLEPADVERVLAEARRESARWARGASAMIPKDAALQADSCAN